MSCGTLSENTQVAYMNCLMTTKKRLDSRNSKCRPYLNGVHPMFPGPDVPPTSRKKLRQNYANIFLLYNFNRNVK